MENQGTKAQETCIENVSNFSPCQKTIIFFLMAWPVSSFEDNLVRVMIEHKMWTPGHSWGVKKQYMLR